MLTSEFRPTGGRRSLTLGRAWNELLAKHSKDADLFLARAIAQKF
jgi:hypothetical protein